MTYTANEFHGIYRGKKYHDEDFDSVLSRAEEYGCQKMILTTMTLTGAQQNLEVCRKYPSKCYMTLGIHPYHAADISSDSDTLQSLTQLCKSLSAQSPSPLVAFGEIGLDYFYLNKASKESQTRAFVAQLELATTFSLPLFLHVRDAYADFVSLITPFLSRLPKRGIVHSFAGTKDEMLGLVNMGFDISVNGVSFRTEEQLEMVRAIPLERLQLETDAPWCEIPATGLEQYLVDAKPLPSSRKHGKFVMGEMVKGRNESCTMERVARIVAGVKGLSVEAVAEAAWANSVRMFGLHGHASS